MKQPAVVGDIHDPSRRLAPLSPAECATSVTYGGQLIAVVGETDLVHPEEGSPPAFPATGSTSITIEGKQAHRVSDSRASGALTLANNPDIDLLFGD